MNASQIAEILNSNDKMTLEHWAGHYFQLAALLNMPGREELAEQARTQAFEFFNAAKALSN